MRLICIANIKPSGPMEWLHKLMDKAYIRAYNGHFVHNGAFFNYLIRNEEIMSHRFRKEENKRDIESRNGKHEGESNPFKKEKYEWRMENIGSTEDIWLNLVTKLDDGEGIKLNYISRTGDTYEKGWQRVCNDYHINVSLTIRDDSSYTRDIVFVDQHPILPPTDFISVDDKPQPCSFDA